MKVYSAFVGYKFSKEIKYPPFHIFLRRATWQLNPKGERCGHVDVYFTNRRFTNSTMAIHKNTCAPHNSEHAAGKHEVINLRIKLYVTQTAAIHVESNSNIRETVKKITVNNLKKHTSNKEYTLLWQVNCQMPNRE